MQSIGKINKNYLEVLQGIYMNYSNPDRDLSVAKGILLNFIIHTHTTHRCHSMCLDDYKLNVAKSYPYSGIKFEMKNNDNIVYIICIKTGNIYFT